MKSKVQSQRSKVSSPKSKAIGWKVRAAALALGFGFWAPDFVALASGGPPVPVEELARRADAVVHGKVASLECARDGAGRMFTRVELDVAGVWKGAATNRFALVLAGGVLGERRVRVVGQAEYRLGEEVVVFTARNPRGEAVTLDLAQGKFTVANETTSGIPQVSNGSLGGPTAKTGHRLPTQVPLALAELRRRVEAVR